ncbi:MAG: 4Fe-4S double cluster binding domain-containing protein [Thermodesulfobacteriota bacterium]
MHLRVLASTTPYEQRALHELGTICTECNDCVEACPAGAIGEESFEGLRCRAYREARGEYIPVGEAQEYHWCTICAQVCLIGEQPNTAR